MRSKFQRETGQTKRSVQLMKRTLQRETHKPSTHSPHPRTHCHHGNTKPHESKTQDANLSELRHELRKSPVAKGREVMSIGGDVIRWVLFWRSVGYDSSCHSAEKTQKMCPAGFSMPLEAHFTTPWQRCLSSPGCWCRLIGNRNHVPLEITGRSFMAAPNQRHMKTGPLSFRCKTLRSSHLLCPIIQYMISAIFSLIFNHF